jgi:hypothetical protein
MYPGLNILIILSVTEFTNFALSPCHEGILGEWRYSSTHSLTSALDGGEWSDSRPGGFTPRKRAAGAHWIGGWVGPRAVLDPVGKRKIPSSRRKSNPRTPIVQPVAQRYTDWAITALFISSCTSHNRIILIWIHTWQTIHTPVRPVTVSCLILLWIHTWQTIHTPVCPVTVSCRPRILDDDLLMSVSVGSQ